MAIRHRRGLESDFDKSKMLQAELAVTTDTKKAFVTFAPNDVQQLSTVEMMNDYIDVKTEDIVDTLTSEVEGVIENSEIRITKAEVAIKDLAEVSKSVIPDVKVSTYSRSSLLSSNAREGQMNVKVSGNTMKNEVVNGNFANGTTGWISVDSASTTSINTLTNTGSGVSATPTVYETTNILCVANKRVFVSALVRVTNSSCTTLATRIQGSTGGSSILSNGITSPVSNQWYKSYAIATIDAGQTGNLRVLVRHSYVDSAIANGKIMEVKDVICIDMGLDTSNPLYNKTVAEMDAMTPYYFDGFSDVKAGVVRTVGKNLLNYKPTNLGFYSATTGVLQSSTTILYTDKINCLPNTTYIMSGYNGTIRVLYWNEENFLSTTTFSSGSITTPLTTTKIAFQSEIGNITNLTQIEQNSVATTFENYTSTVKYLPYASLKSLPNGVKDYIDGSRYVKNVSDVKTLLASDITALVTTNVNNDFVRISTSITDNPLMYGRVDTDIIGTKINTSVSQPRNGIAFDSVGNVWKHQCGNGGEIVISIPKGTYANLSAAQTALTGTKIIYQLATPIVTEILPNTVKSSPNGSVQYLNVRGEVGYYGTNIAVTNSALPIKSLTSVKKINISDGSEINIDLATCTIASGGLTFTSTALVAGDLVDWNYEFDSALSTTPLLDYEYNNNTFIQEPWNTVSSFLNGWLAYDTANAPKYRKTSTGEVKLKGIVKSGTINANMFELPVGYRPLTDRLFPVVTNGTIGYVRVNVNGTVLCQLGNNAYVDFSPISFFTD